MRTFRLVDLNRSKALCVRLVLPAALIMSLLPLRAADAPAPVTPAPAPVTPAPAPTSTAGAVASTAAETGAITEQDYDAYVKLDTKLKEIDQRTAAAKDDNAKAEAAAAAPAARAAAFKESGMSEARYNQVNTDVTQVKTLLNPSATDVKNNPQAAAQGLAVLQLFDPVTVATVKAKTQPASAKANKLTNQALGGFGKVQAATKPTPPPASTLPAETPVDAAKLPGTWLFDLDASCEAVRPGLNDDMKKIVKARLMTILNASKYTFGPADAATSYALNSADGTETTNAATYTCDGKVVTFTSTVDGHTKSLDCAMRGEYLMLGKGAQKAAFKKKAE